MNQELTTNFLGDFNDAKNQQSLAQYFDDDAKRRLFTQVVTRAVQEKPELLTADRTSLFLACQAAAQDGLMPDNKQGVLNIYNTNIGTHQNPKWIKKVQWQPMIGGLRLKLAMHGFRGLRAELVYEKDVSEGRFTYEKGDDPKIVHNPNVFGDRGALVGAYAVVTDTNTGEIYRDAMGLEELEMARSKSRSPSSGAWKDWTNEMYRKTMARRLFKTLPLLSEELLTLMDRDDKTNYNFQDVASTAPSSVAQQVQAAARGTIDGEVQKKPKTTKKKTAKKVPAKKAAPEPVAEVEEDDEPQFDEEGRPILAEGPPDDNPLGF